MPSVRIDKENVGVKFGYSGGLVERSVAGRKSPLAEKENYKLHVFAFLYYAGVKSACATFGSTSSMVRIRR